MIITRAPFRISFCGGGSDLPRFYEQYGGCVVSTTIRKYVYLCLHNYFEKDEIVLKYSGTEKVKAIGEIRHNIFRQCLHDFNVSGVEITSMADVPAGTGLGSSSSFTVALLHLLNTYVGKSVSKYKIAKDACDVEINRLGEPIGKQDQYAAAFGGLRFYEFHPNGFVSTEPILVTKEMFEALEHNLLMFYTGGTRSASKILKSQNEGLSDERKVKAQLRMCDIARSLKDELDRRNVDALGEMLHENWLLKKSLAPGISSPEINDAYDSAIAAGATGGKLLGAGGGGFLLFYVPTESSRQKVKKALSGMREFGFELDNSGSSIVFIDKDNG